MAALPSLEAFRTERLVCVPMRVEDADEMVAVLEDASLYEFIGGAAPTLGELRDRYRRQVAGSPDPAQRWLNWIVRFRAFIENYSG